MSNAPEVFATEAAETVTEVGIGAAKLVEPTALGLALAQPDKRVLALTGDGRLAVNLTGDEAVAIVDLAEQTVLAVHALGGVLHGIAITDDRDAAVVSLMDLDKIARVRLADGATTFRDLAPAPYHVTAVPGSAKTFVSSAAGTGLTVIDERDLSILGRIDTSGVGHQMAPIIRNLDLGVTQ